MGAPDATTETVTINVEGRTVAAHATRSIIEAIWDADYTLVTNVGCLGQGVCGSCRVMVRRAGGDSVSMELACETTIESTRRRRSVHSPTPQNSPSRPKRFAR